jgi:hypothetical protein
MYLKQSLFLGRIVLQLFRARVQSVLHVMLFRLGNEFCTFTLRGPGSSVGIATGYGLDGLGIESRWRRDFRTRPDLSCGPPRLLYNGYRDFPRGRKEPGRDADP